MSDLHSKFAVRPHHVWRCGRHPICDGRERQEKKEKERKEDETTGRKYNGLPAAIINEYDNHEYYK